MTEVSFEPETTRERYKSVSHYLRSAGFTDDREYFNCRFLRRCEASMPEGCRLEPGDPALNHQGERYDMKVNEEPLRILFVGYDTGQGPGVEIRKDRNHLTQHYRGIVKTLMEIFQEKYESENEEGLRSLLKRCAQTNATRCCAPYQEGISMRNNTTPSMRENCWEHFRAEIKRMEPSILFFHGAELRDSFLGNLHREGMESHPVLPSNKWESICREVEWTGPNFPKAFTSLLFFYKHPARGHFFRQWETQVVPVLKELRQHGILPTLSDSWQSLGNGDWPTG